MLQWLLESLIDDKIYLFDPQLPAEFCDNVNLLFMQIHEDTDLESYAAWLSYHYHLCPVFVSTIQYLKWATTLPKSTIITYIQNNLCRNCIETIYDSI